MAALNDVESGPERSWLWPLVGIAAILGLWSGSESLRDRAQALELQLLSVATQPTRDVGQMLAQAERGARTVGDQRTQIEAELRAAEPVELIQTRFLYILRQRCQAAGIGSCLVKYAGEPSRTGTTATATAGGSTVAGKVVPLSERPAAEVGLEQLGLANARAVVSGSFQTRELLDFFQALGDDGSRRFRVIALVVRGSTFDAEIEQIVRPMVQGNGRS